MRASVAAGGVALVLSLGLNGYFLLGEASSPPAAEGSGRAPRSGPVAEAGAQSAQPTDGDPASPASVEGTPRPVGGASAGGSEGELVALRAELAESKREVARLRASGAQGAEAPRPLEEQLTEVLQLLASGQPEEEGASEAYELEMISKVLALQERGDDVLARTTELVRSSEGTDREAAMELLQIFQEFPGVSQEARERSAQSLVEALEQAQDEGLQQELLGVIDLGENADLRARVARVLLGRTRSTGSNVREDAIKRLRDFPGAETQAAFARIAADGQETDSNRVKAIEPLDLAQPAHADLVLRLARSKSSELRGACYRKMRQLDASRVLPLLHEGLNQDPDARVRSKILATIRKIASISSVPVLEAFVRDEARDTKERLSAEAALDWIKNPKKRRKGR